MVVLERMSTSDAEKILREGEIDVVLAATAKPLQKEKA